MIEDFSSAGGEQLKCDFEFAKKLAISAWRSIVEGGSR
jgi:hypothetical protein